VKGGKINHIIWLEEGIFKKSPGEGFFLITNLKSKILNKAIKKPEKNSKNSLKFKLNFLFS